MDRLTIELETLKRYKYRLTKQEYLTFKSQIFKHDYEGFRNSLWKLLMKKLNIHSNECFFIAKKS